MVMYGRSPARKPRLHICICSTALLLSTLSACGTTETPPISYPCKNPELGHLGPDGAADPCHFEDPDSPAQAVNKFFSAVSGPFCDALYTCCTDQMFLGDLAGGSLHACKAIWADGTGLGSKMLLALKESLVNGTTVYEGTQLDACVARLEQRLMSPPMGAAACVEPVPFLLLNTCFGASFHGQIAPGDACKPWPRSPEDLSFVECQSGRCEDGQCVAFLKNGDKCNIFAYPSDRTDTVCDFVQGQWCKGNGATATCGTRSEIGDACEAHLVEYECKSMKCTDQTCTPLAPTSTACDVF